MKPNLHHILSEQRFTQITENFSKIDPVIVVGDIGIDKYTYGEVKRISPEAPVPVLEVSKQWTKLGLAANISHNLQTLGVESLLCGIVGEDSFASDFEHLLEDCHLKIWGLVRDDNYQTIVKERVTTKNQQICRIDFESSQQVSSSASLKILDRVSEFVRPQSALILEDYAKGLLSEKLCHSLIQKYKEAGHLIAVDPGRNTPPSFYKGATLLKPNWAEAQQMCQSLGHYENNLEKMAEILVEKCDVEMLVITLGGEGMALFDRKESSPSLKIIPTVATEVFDVSGAGDTSIALLVSSLMSGATLEEAAWLANCGAGVVVAKKGTAVVSFEELKLYHKRLLDRYKN